jgi:hypothetical protein
MNRGGNEPVICRGNNAATGDHRLVTELDAAPVAFSSGISDIADSPVSILISGFAMGIAGIATLRLS